jgi:hypothetical protein
MNAQQKTEPQWVVLITTDAVQAEMIAERLRAEGLAAMVKADGLGSPFGLFLAMRFVSVLVWETQAEPAQDMLDMWCEI